MLTFYSKFIEFLNEIFYFFDFIYIWLHLYLFFYKNSWNYKEKILLSIINWIYWIKSLFCHNQITNKIFSKMLIDYMFNSLHFLIFSYISKSIENLHIILRILVNNFIRNLSTIEIQYNKVKIVLFDNFCRFINSNTTI